MSLRKQEIADRLNAWIIFHEKNKELCDWLTQMENKVVLSADLNIEEMVEKLKKVKTSPFKPLQGSFVPGTFSLCRRSDVCGTVSGSSQLMFEVTGGSSVVESRPRLLTALLLLLPAQGIVGVQKCISGA